MRWLEADRALAATGDLEAAMGNTLDGTGGRGDYQSYLLRVWRESAEDAVWRGSLEDPRTGERAHFATLKSLFYFLQQQTEGGPTGGT